jgi:hypothetical protein
MPNPPRDRSDYELERAARQIDRPHKIDAPRQTLPIAGQRKGRYDEAMGPGLRDHYRVALNDSKLLDLRDPLAAQDAIIVRLMNRLEDKDSPEFRYHALQLSADLVDEIRSGGKDINYRADKLHEYLERGANEDRALRSIGSQLDRLRRGVVDAWKIKLGKKQAINARDLVQIMGTFLDVVRSETMPSIFTRIAARIDLEVFSGNGALLLKEKAAPREVEVLNENRNGSRVDSEMRSNGIADGGAAAGAGGADAAPEGS